MPIKRILLASLCTVLLCCPGIARSAGHRGGYSSHSAGQYRGYTHGHSVGYSSGYSRRGASHTRSYLGRPYSGRSSARLYSTRSHSSSTRCSGCVRDSRGRIARSSRAKREFKKSHPCPGSCSDYVVDHLVPLKRGGSDTPDNMQWQTKRAAKAKDKTE
jgi:hypothetical protein